MRSNDFFYKPTGLVNVFKLPFTLLLILPIWVISFLYAGLLHYNPITFLGPLIFAAYAVSIGQIVVLGINIAEVRNRWVGIFIGLFFFSCALYFSWSQFLTLWSNGFPLYLLQPEHLWAALQNLFNEGAYSTFSIQIDGYFGAIIWVLEAAFLGIFCLKMADNTVNHEIYCENCRKWISPIEGFYEFQYDNEQVLLSNLNLGNLDFLEHSQKVEEGSTKYYRIDASCCNTCATSNFLSLQKITTEVDQDDPKSTSESTELLIEHLGVSQQSFDKLYDKSHHWFHYTESGKYKHSLWLGIPIAAFAIYFLGWFYQAISMYLTNNNFGEMHGVAYAFNGLAFLLYAAVIALLTMKILQFFNSRNAVVTNYFGLMLGVMAVYLTNMGLVGGLGEIIWHPDILWFERLQLVHVHEFEYLGWTGLLLETGILLLAPLVGAFSIADSRVYCENCQNWADEEEDILVFDYDDAEELKIKFRNQELDYLDQIKVIPYSAEKTILFRINAEWCKGCDTIHTLSLEQVTRTYNSRDRDYGYSYKSIYEDLIYSKEGFDKVMDFAKEWHELHPLVPKEEEVVEPEKKEQLEVKK